MKNANIVITWIAGAAVVATVAAWGLIGGSAGSNEKAIANTNGNLRVPQGYRSTYQMLGSWAIAADQGQGSKEIHAVYASPGVIASYLENGRFPEGAVLVREVFETATEQMTTGTVSRAGTLKGWFVMLKDSSNRYPANKLCADGWGWSWFEANNPSRTTSTDYKTDCQSCHAPAQATDWVYAEGYPPLKR